MEFTGIILKVMDLECGTTSDGKEWKSRDVVIEDDSREYPESVAVRMKGQNAENFDIPVGLRVRASIACYARSYTDRNGKERASTDLNCWRVERV